MKRPCLDSEQRSAIINDTFEGFFLSLNIEIKKMQRQIYKEEGLWALIKFNRQLKKGLNELFMPTMKHTFNGDSSK